MKPLHAAEKIMVALAHEFETSLLLAAFADNEPSLGEPIAAELRCYARMKSEDAFELSRAVVRLRRSA